MKIGERHEATDNSRRARIVGMLACVLLVAFYVSASAQEPGRMFRIGYQDVGTTSGGAVLVEAFRSELAKLGWIEEKNIVTEYRFANGKTDHLAGLVVELVQSHVDAIVGTSTATALAAKTATKAIPIVVTNASDPVAAGLVANLARPGGNVTGFSGLSAELNTKRLEILKDVVPKLTRVGLFAAQRRWRIARPSNERT